MPDAAGQEQQGAERAGGTARRWRHACAGEESKWRRMGRADLGMAWEGRCKDSVGAAGSKLAARGSKCALPLAPLGHQFAANLVRCRSSRSRSAALSRRRGSRDQQTGSSRPAGSTAAHCHPGRCSPGPPAPAADPLPPCRQALWWRQARGHQDPQARCWQAPAARCRWVGGWGAGGPQGLLLHSGPGWGAGCRQRRRPLPAAPSGSGRPGPLASPCVAAGSACSAAGQPTVEGGIAAGHG